MADEPLHSNASEEESDLMARSALERRGMSSEQIDAFFAQAKATQPPELTEEDLNALRRKLEASRKEHGLPPLHPEHAH